MPLINVWSHLLEVLLWRISNQVLYLINRNKISLKILNFTLSNFYIIIASRGWDCSSSWPELERRIQSLCAVILFLFTPKALEMVGSEVLLRQPQDEAKQELDENQAHPHPTSISYFLFLCKQGGDVTALRIDVPPYLQVSPEFSAALPLPLLPQHQLTTARVFSNIVYCLLSCGFILKVIGTLNYLGRIFRKVFVCLCVCEEDWETRP